MDVTLELTSLPGVQGDLPSLWENELRPTIIPASEFEWPLLSHMGTAGGVRVIMTYTENGEARTETQDVSLN